VATGLHALFVGICAQNEQAQLADTSKAYRKSRAFNRFNIFVEAFEKIDWKQNRGLTSFEACKSHDRTIVF